MRPLVSPVVAALPRYSPGKAISAVKRELGLSEIVKLASNESPFGPSPRAVEAMRAALGDTFRYPDDAAELREALAAPLGVKPDQVLLGAGATDLIELCVRTFGTPQGHAVVSHGSFIAYRLFLLAGGAPFTEAPLKDAAVDLDAIAAAVRPDTQLIFVANPNNPTGSRFGQAAFERFLAGLPPHVVLVLDDAYRDYNDAALDTVAVVKRRPRTVVLRSFSKVHGLAGMRVGYAISSDELISALQRVQRPFPVSGVAIAGARAALFDDEHFHRTVEGTRSGRAWLRERLQTLGFSVLESHTNFVTVALASPKAVDALTDRLLHQGIIIRPLGAFGLPAHARISVGEARELDLAIAALGAVLREAPGLKDGPGAHA